MMGGAMPGGQVTCSIQDLITLIQAVSGGGGSAAGGASKPKASGKADQEGKLDQILQLLQGAMGGAGAPPPAAPPAGA